MKMKTEDIASYIRSDAKSIQRISWDAAMNQDEVATYLHAIDILANHIIEQTRIIASIKND